MSLHLQTATDEHWLWEWGQLKLEPQVTGGELGILFSSTERAAWQQQTFST
jgi:hypothetical protein